MDYKYFNRLRFPKGFLWGAAASAPQTEGESLAYGKSPNTWDKWFEMAPEVFSSIGPGRTSNVYNLYKEDVRLMKDTSINSYRTSISWTRLLPDGETVNQEAVAYYRDYFKLMKSEGIEPIVNLFHFDMPWWMMEKGGWLNPEIIDKFSFYAKQCVLLFGDIVKSWVTFNEPIVHVECSYLYGYHYPAIRDFKKAVLCGYHTILAHAYAIKAMKEVSSDIVVGTILNLTPIYSRSDSQEDLKAAKYAQWLNVDSFLEPMVKGTFSQNLVNLLKENNLLFECNKKDIETVRENTAEFLGVNYYQPKRVQAPNQKVNKPAQFPEDFYVPYEWKERRINPYRGWEIYPEALYDISILIRDQYDNIPWYVSENGIGVANETEFLGEDGMIQDDYRIDFIQEHLVMLHKGIEAGSHCFGYHLWTFVDCWSWLNGYNNRYGLFSLDLKTQKRTVKKSGLWFRDFIEQQNEKLFNSITNLDEKNTK